MRTVDLIVAKRDGLALDPKDIEAFVKGVVDGSIPDYQAAAFLMAVYFKGMETEELVAYARAMLHSGAVLDLPTVEGFKVDKHSTGGVGDKVSLTLAPMVAACGLSIPMISGRGLGHTGGTLDKLEAIPGMDVELSGARFEQCVREVGFSISGQTAELVPADKKLYALRDVTGTVASVELIAASIMSKKLAEGIKGLVLDVKTGSGAFMKRHEDAQRLAKTMISIGEGMGCSTRAWITNMDQPLGRAVGNANEVAEAIAALRGEGPADYTEVCMTLGAEMLQLAGLEATEAAARQRLQAVVDSGDALQRFARFVEAQGGDPRVVEDAAVMPQLKTKLMVEAPRAGVVAAFDTTAVGRACGVLGGGRAKADDAIDHAVGFDVLAKIGDSVQVGDPLFEITYRDQDSAQQAKALLLESLTLAEEAVAPKLIIERL